MATVLIVDDAAIMRANLKKMLEKLGHEVLAESVNGFDAIEDYQIYNPDFVTMDISMPGKNGIKDGIDAVEKIKINDPDAKIIMITSHGEQEKVIKAIHNGASNYILKPIHIDKFEEVIDKLQF
jgi:two-component system chemotaxis response regulator CheY